MIQDDPANTSADPGRRRVYVRDAVVLGAAVGVFGIAFGVLASESGLSAAKACAMSLLVFTGASQFAAVSVIGAGGAPVTAVASALLLAARNGVYGLALSPHIGARGVRRAAAAQLVIDESTALGVAQSEPTDVEGAFWWAGASVFVAWNLGTLFGVLAGHAIGDPDALGLDAAFPAGFVSLMMPQLRDRSKLCAAAFGAAIAAVAVPFTQPGVPVLLAAPAAIVALASARRWST
jgi:4-azaleucine resistance transporter AzlC